MKQYTFLKESYNTTLYDFFEKNIYPKIKNTSIQVAKQMFIKAKPKSKIVGIDDFCGLEIDYVDPDKKIYKGCVEGSIDYNYIDEYGYKDNDGMYYHVIVFFNLDGWYKIARIYLGT